MFRANGFIVQDEKYPYDHAGKFSYRGLCSYDLFPLMHINDPVCRKLTDEQFSREVAENEFVIPEFVSDYGLLKRYVMECVKREIGVRILFAESEYSEETYNGDLPVKEFLGYEYCPVPIDCQIITDLDLYEPFWKYHRLLNRSGLFDSYEEVISFAEEYCSEFDKGNIGDGEIDAYIFKVYEIDVKNIL
ncbi:MAG: hypothetical protein IKM61_06445 [Eubacteriaceae bacterium]|nr:hypothetical protein [Eubacteriaceae bacterium]